MFWVLSVEMSVIGAAVVILRAVRLYSLLREET